MPAHRGLSRRALRRRSISALALLGVLTGTAYAAGAQVPADETRSVLAPRGVVDLLGIRHPDLLMSEGHALYDAGHYKEAAASFEQAMQLGVSRPHLAAKKVAQSYARLGNRKQARRWAEIAELLERNPDNGLLMKASYRRER